jgi:hypothetical protein
MWGLYLPWLVIHPANRVTLGLDPDPSPIARLMIGLGAGAFAIAVVAYVVSAIVRGRRQVSTRSAWFTLGPVVALTAFALFGVGAMEPLIPAPTNPEQTFLAMAVVIGIMHSIQYLGIVAVTNRRRHAAAKRPGLTRFLAAPALLYALCLTAAPIYLALNIGRGATPGAEPFAPASLPAQLAVVVYWSVFFHHYYLDQRIWHPRRDPSLARELGMA